MLGSAEGGLACEEGHRFDRARSGYVNLLQPDERRSARPGDGIEASRARRRLWEAGVEAPLSAALLEELRASIAGPAAAILDVGCGEGSMLAALSAELQLEGHGVDISTPSIDLAARTYRRLHFVVANADRRLPFADGCIDVATCVNAHASLPELARVVATGGWVAMVLPGPDDLREVREAIAGEAVPKERLAALRERLPGDLEVVRERRLSWRFPAGSELLDDVLRATYRGARRREAERLAARPPGDVTRSQEIVLLRCGRRETRGA